MNIIRRCLAGLGTFLVLFPLCALGGSLEKYQMLPKQSTPSYQLEQRMGPSPIPNLPVYQEFREYAQRQSGDQIDSLLRTYIARKSGPSSKETGTRHPTTTI